MKKLLLLIFMIPFFAKAQGGFSASGSLDPLGAYSIVKWQYINGVTQYGSGLPTTNNVAKFNLQSGIHYVDTVGKQEYQYFNGIWQKFNTGYSKAQTDSLTALYLKLTGGELSGQLISSNGGSVKSNIAYLNANFLAHITSNQFDSGRMPSYGFLIDGRDGAVMEFHPTGGLDYGVWLRNINGRVDKLLSSFDSTVVFATPSQTNQLLKGYVSLNNAETINGTKTLNSYLYLNYPAIFKASGTATSSSNEFSSAASVYSVSYFDNGVVSKDDWQIYGSNSNSSNNTFLAFNVNDLPILSINKSGTADYAAHPTSFNNLSLVDVSLLNSTVAASAITNYISTNTEQGSSASPLTGDKYTTGFWNFGALKTNRTNTTDGIKNFEVSNGTQSLLSITQTGLGTSTIHQSLNLDGPNSSDSQYTANDGTFQNSSYNEIISGKGNGVLNLKAATVVLPNFFSGNAGMQQIKASNIEFIPQGPNATGVSTQSSSGLIAMNINLWDGSKAVSKRSYFQDIVSSSEALRHRVSVMVGGVEHSYFDSNGSFKTGAITSTGAVTGTSFIKTNGTSLQFLKADGSIDSTQYLSNASSANFLNRSDANTDYQGTISGSPTLPNYIASSSNSNPISVYTFNSSNAYSNVTLPNAANNFSNNKGYRLTFINQNMQSQSLIAASGNTFTQTGGSTFIIPGRSIVTVETSSTSTWSLLNLTSYNNTVSFNSTNYSGDFGIEYMFSGTTCNFTLPSILNNIQGKPYAITINNEGTGNITVNVSGSNNAIYTNQVVSTDTITPGTTATYTINGTTYKRQ